MQNKNYQEFAQQVLFIDDLEKIIGRNRLTLRRWWMEDKFPRPTKLHGTTLAWHTQIVQDWINKNINV